MMSPLTLEDVLAATRAIARIMPYGGGATEVALRIKARAAGDLGETARCGRMSLAAAARLELERSGDCIRKQVSQRRLLQAAAALCSVLAAEPTVRAAENGSMR